MSWSGWKDPVPEQTGDPYAGWFRELSGDQESQRGKLFSGDPGAARADRNEPLERFADLLGLNPLDDSLDPSILFPRDNDQTLPEEMQALAAEIKELLCDAVAPSHALDDRFAWTLPDPKEIETIPANSVIVGVIDKDIPLGHRRTWLGNQQTRILSAWQQMADRTRPGVPAARARVPFGEEHTGTELNALLTQHSLDGWLDEEAFNTATGTLDLRQAFGQRALNRHLSHGAHVMGRAAGMEMADPYAARMRIVAVNLPSTQVLGTSGAFLELYTILGICRIVQVADAAAAKIGKADKFPIVINFSFGRQAGGRDGFDVVARYLKALNDLRSAKGQNRIWLSVPALNNNLRRVGASVALPRNSEPAKPIQWRVKPEDQSSNYVEIWSEPFPEAHWPPGADVPIQISIETPTGAALPFLGATTGKIAEIPNIARVYCHREARPGNKVRVRYTICVAPTLVQSSSAQGAPAGVWKLKFKNKLNRFIRLELSIQTDQSTLPDRGTGLTSNFEEPEYVRFDKTTGRPIDSFEHGVHGRKPVILGSTNLVQRRNTMTATGVDKDHTLVSAGYRATDGVPAVYSATGGGMVRAEGRGLAEPSVAMVTEDSAATWGILSAGSRDGSVAAMRGTSFGCSQLTFELARALLVTPGLDANAWLSGLKTGGAVKDHVRPRLAGTDPLKVGRGRYPVQHYRGLKRLG